VLVVRLTYGPTEGRYSLPGGWQDVGEQINTAAIREVREETQVQARRIGLTGMRTRTESDSQPQRSIVDLMWLLEHEQGEPQPDEQEADDARFMPFDEALRRDDVEDIVKYLVQRLQTGTLAPQCHVGQNADGSPVSTPEEWKLFV
jgi:ADP-ribose pyrophosphatase YjhB (NUDIX family)